ncbi:MAG: response regulator [Rickettsiales bacterium]
MVEVKKDEIWVVDDSVSVQMQVGNALKKSGYSNVHIITTADEAIKRLETATPKLIVTDSNTASKMDGADVLKAAAGKKIPAIMISGEKTLEEPAKGLGAVEFFCKMDGPKYVTGLVEKVDTLFGHTQQASTGRVM